MAGHGNERIDVLRKGGIVIALVGGMTLLHSFGTLSGAGFDPTAMLALGFVVLASYTFGELVGVVKLPHITGYLLAGFLLGSSAADMMGTILADGPTMLGPWFGDGAVASIQQLLPAHLPAPFDHGVLHGEYNVVSSDGSITTIPSIPDQLSIFNSLAIALIAMTAGGELKLSALRKGLRTIMGVLFGQTIAILVLVTLFVIAVSGLFVDWIALPFSAPHSAESGAVAIAHAGAALGQLSFVGVLCMGGLVATISVATSPAATIAVINSVRAKGAMTETVLSVVVLKDVVVVLLFAIIAAVASAVIAPESLQPLHDATANISEQIEHVTSPAHAPVTAPDTSHAPATSEHASATPSQATMVADDGAHGDSHSPKSFYDLVIYLLKHIGLALVLGVGLGLGIALYLRYVGIEIVLFLVGVVFTVTFAANAAQVDVTLLFIAAGFAATNFSREGDQLIHELERLGVPVYVVFFTLTGAALHIDTLVELLPFALALVAIRTFGIWSGIRLGATVMGASEPIKKYSWLGFISQAGVAIVLAKIVEGQFGQSGATISSLIIAGVAIHEVIGPIALKVSLGLAGEIPKPDVEPEPEPVFRQEVENDESSSTNLAWSPLPGVPDPWGDAPSLESLRLAHTADELRADLRGFVRDLHSGHLARWTTHADDYLKSLRKEFLRHHRRTQVHLQEESPDLALKIRAEQAKIADRWRD
ncbi:MAG: Kef-type K+ transport system membrane component KefB, partial [Kiritimatiellia bacterium]